MRILLAMLAFMTSTVWADEYLSPFQDQHRDFEILRPTLGLTLGSSSYKTDANGILLGPSGGASYFIENSTGEWIFLGDGHLTLLSGLSPDGAAIFASAGVAGGHFIEFLHRVLMLGVEYRYSFAKSVDSAAVIRLLLTPEPQAAAGFGAEFQYTVYTRETSIKRTSYPTPMFVARYYF